MKKSWLQLGAIGSLAILTSSCGGGDNKPAPSPSASPNPTASPAAATPAATPAPVAAAPATTTPTTPTSTINTAPTVPGTTATKPVSPDVAVGLIPPTNGETWARTVSKGRTDPFALVPIQIPAGIFAQEKIGQSGINKSLPKIATASGSQSLPSITSSSRTGTDISQIPRTGINRKLPKIIVAVKPSSTPSASVPSPKLPPIALRPGAGEPPIGRPPIGVRPGAGEPPMGRPPLRPTNIGAPETPRLPQIIGAKPEPVAEKVLQAMAVEVSGIIEVEGKTQVIVKLPNETASRYVDVGDRLTGNIFVKRVEGQTTLSPTVVFEENGREVERKVGDKSTASADTAAK